MNEDQTMEWHSVNASYDPEGNDPPFVVSSWAIRLPGNKLFPEGVDLYVCKMPNSDEVLPYAVPAGTDPTDVMNWEGSVLDLLVENDDPIAAYCTYNAEKRRYFDWRDEVSRTE